VGKIKELDRNEKFDQKMKSTLDKVPCNPKIVKRDENKRLVVDMTALEIYGSKFRTKEYQSLTDEEQVLFDTCAKNMQKILSQYSVGSDEFCRAIIDENLALCKGLSKFYRLRKKDTPESKGAEIVIDTNSEIFKSCAAYILAHAMVNVPYFVDQKGKEDVKITDLIFDFLKVAILGEEQAEKYPDFKALEIACEKIDEKIQKTMESACISDSENGATKRVWYFESAEEESLQIAKQIFNKPTVKIRGKEIEPNAVAKGQWSDYALTAEDKMRGIITEEEYYILWAKEIVRTDTNTFLQNLKKLEPEAKHLKNWKSARVSLSVMREYQLIYLFRIVPERSYAKEKEADDFIQQRKLNSELYRDKTYLRLARKTFPDYPDDEIQGLRRYIGGFLPTSKNPSAKKDIYCNAMINNNYATLMLKCQMGMLELQMELSDYSWYESVNMVDNLMRSAADYTEQDYGAFSIYYEEGLLLLPEIRRRVMCFWKDLLVEYQEEWQSNNECATQVFLKCVSSPIFKKATEHQVNTLIQQLELFAGVMDKYTFYIFYKGQLNDKEFMEEFIFDEEILQPESGSAVFEEYAEARRKKYPHLQ
jgi:hypothetical protein